MPTSYLAARGRACAFLVVVAGLMAGCGSGSVIFVTVTVEEQPPIANAGPDRVGRVNTLVTLDRSASLDPEGSALTFHWVQTEGPVVAFSSATAVQPTFTPAVPGTYVFSLQVEEDATAITSPPATIMVIVIDDVAAQPRRAPGAVARAAGLRRATFLDVAPALASGPPTVVLADGSVRTVLIVDLAADPSDDPAPGSVAGRLQIVVVVGPAVFATLYAELQPGDEDPVHLDFGGGSTPPVVGFAVAGTSFVLDGSRSQDDGVIQTYSWTQVDGPFRFSTEDPQVDAVIDAPGLYVFDLTVTDNTGLSSFPQRLTVPVIPAGLPAVGPPEARAAFVGGTVVVGTDDTPEVSIVGTPVLLGGAGSVSRNGGALTFSWSQVDGPPARFNTTSGELISVVPQTAGTYVFALQVTDDNGCVAVDELELTVAAPGTPPPTPSLLPIPDQVLAPGGIPPLVVVLDGTHSSGAGPLTFRWHQTRGVPVFIEDAASGLGSVVPPAVGLYEFELAVFDGTSLSAPVRRSFRVR